MKSYFTAALGLIILASCTEQMSTTSSGQPAEEAFARILVIEEHPFDLEAALTNPDGINLANTLRFLASRDTETINTDYDEMKSVVTVIRGPLPSGTRVTLKFRRSADDQATYEIHNDVVPTTENNPVIFINSYKINRRANVRVRAFIDGRMIAEKRFKARGPTDNSKPNWVMKEGDIRLTAKELRETIIGKRFRLDVGGTGFFSSDGSYTRVRPERTKIGTYEVRDDGFTCTNFKNDRERCYIFVRDRRGNLHIINDRSRRYRIEPEA